MLLVLEENCITTCRPHSRKSILKTQGQQLSLCVHAQRKCDFKMLARESMFYIKLLVIRTFSWFLFISFLFSI